MAMISILMPIYNGSEFMEYSIPSILAQTYTDWELLIGINGHEANSAVYEQARTYSSDKVHVLDLPHIKGKAATLNELLSYVHRDAEWISILDVDDIWLKDKLSRQVPFLESYDVVGTHCLYFGDLSGQPRIPTGDISTFDFTVLNPVINSSVLIRRPYAHWSESTDPIIFGKEDYDLWLQLRRQGLRFYNVEEALVLHRIHQASHFNARGNSKSSALLAEKYRRAD